MTQVRDAETDACSHGHAAEGAYDQTPRTTATRYQGRVGYDRTAVHAVLDEAVVCHLAFVLDGAPVALPTRWSWPAAGCTTRCRSAASWCTARPELLPTPPSASTPCGP